MPASRPFPRILGELKVSSGDHRIAIEGAPGRLIVRFGSIGTLNEIRKTAARLMPSPSNPASAPMTFTGVPETIIALGSRPIARIDLNGGKPVFVPTPLKALTTKV